MQWDRAAGLLLHPSSLPGPYGIGELGPQAHTFISALAECGCRLWQILPLGPGSGYTNSPYAAYSAFAGNPLLISIEALLAEGWIAEAELPAPPEFDEKRIDFEALKNWKLPVLHDCYTRFFREAGETEKGWFEKFSAAHASWLDDYALYMAIKDSTGGKPWMAWPVALRRRHARALEKSRRTLGENIRFHKFLQFLFNRQWEAIRNHCREAGIRIIGDVPIFVAQDSADVWVHQELFYLEKNGLPKVVAGVPPDYFSNTGQLWGNPLYNWKKHKHRDYAWWLARLQLMFQHVDIIRIDHFRGLEAYWEIPAADQTAEHGRWVKGPGADFLEAIRKRFGELPIIAEDLGVITPEVDALRRQFKLPGMRVLHFAFGGENPKTATHLPHNHTPDSVVYTGTHDNDTTVGWLQGGDREADLRSDEQRELERRNFLNYINLNGKKLDASEACWQMIALAFSSVARTAIIPFQDLLGLDSSTRMNRPGTQRRDNWAWRMTPKQLAALTSPEIRDRLRTLLWRYGRL